MEIVLFVAGSIGLAHIMVDGKILLPLRNWLANPVLPWWLGWLSYAPEFLKSFFKWFVGKASEMITCHQCAGLWAGLLVGLLAFRDLSFWQWLACGFAGSFLSMFIAIYYNYLEAQTIIKLPPEEPTNPAPPPT